MSLHIIKWLLLGLLNSFLYFFSLFSLKVKAFKNTYVIADINVGTNIKAFYKWQPMMFSSTSGLYEEYIYDVKFTTIVYQDVVYPSYPLRVYFYWYDDVSPTYMGY